MSRRIQIIPSPEKGEVISVDVIPEQTTGQLMGDLGYRGTTFVRDDHYLGADAHFTGRAPNSVDLLMDEDCELQPYRLGLAQ